MSINFADLKKARRNSTTEDLKSKLKAETKTSGDQLDGKLWKPTMKKCVDDGTGVIGTSSDIIRFLPESNADLRLVAEGKYFEGQLSPIFHRKHHAFEGPNGWYFEESREMLIIDNNTMETAKCPVRGVVQPLWNAAKESGNKDQEAKIKKMFTQNNYYANILVVNDSGNPENNGKVFLFKLTTDMRKLLDSAITPKFEDEEAFQPFNEVEGRNFNLRLEYSMVSFGKNSYPVAKYNNAKFQSSTTPIADTDDGIEAILDKAYSFFTLFLDKIKPEDVLIKKIEKVFSFDSDKLSTEEFESKLPVSHEELGTKEESSDPQSLDDEFADLLN